MSEKAAELGWAAAAEALPLAGLFGDPGRPAVAVSVTLDGTLKAVWPTKASGGLEMREAVLDGDALAAFFGAFAEAQRKETVQ